MSRDSALVIAFVIVLFAVLGVLAGLNVFEAVGVAVVGFALYYGMGWVINSLSARREKDSD